VTADFSALLRHQDQIIERVGWAVTAVLPTPEHPGAPFAYTVGLTAHFTDLLSSHRVVHPGAWYARCRSRLPIALVVPCACGDAGREARGANGDGHR